MRGTSNGHMNISYGKVTLASVHAMKACVGSTSINERILNLGIRWR
jgi:tetrahydromethanopterin S-methyltransferase subunit C